jgi:hypothetical protein
MIGAIPSDPSSYAAAATWGLPRSATSPSSATTPVGAGSVAEGGVTRPGGLGGDVVEISGAGASAKTGKTECQTCKERRYVDGSDDPGVSFKNPQYVAPAASAAAVASHEREHVNREQVKAKDEGRRVISQTVQIKTAVCPECGRTYVAGGTTTTVTAKSTPPSPAASTNGASPHGRHLDKTA